MNDEKKIPPGNQEQKESIHFPVDEQSPKPAYADLAEEQHFPEDKRAVAAARMQRSNQETQTASMEVHHHGHVHETKKWKEYLFQFVMLFLAVFCGFLAEYKLEHVIEHKREKQYMRTLLEDLKKDTMNLEECIQFWTRLSDKIDHTRPLLKSSPGYDRDEIYEMAAMLVDFNDFIYSDRTIEQLRNSGNFRLIRKHHVSDTLMTYDSFIRVQLKEQETTLLKMLLDVLGVQNELLDSDKVELKFRQLKNINSPLGSIPAKYTAVNRNKDEKLFKYYNDLFVYRVGLGYLISSERGLKKWASNLIELVKREYHLD